MQHQQYAQVSRSQGRGKPCPYHTRISWFLLYMVGATARVALEACQRGGGWCWCYWCCCSSSPGRPLSLPNSPDFWMLLVTWFLAGVVGIITALLVKSPGEKQARRATQPSRRDLSPVVWPAIFPMLFFLLTLPGVLPLFDVSLPVPFWARLSYCLFAVFVSGMTVLIVTIRGSKPRFEKPLQVWGVFIPAVLFIP